MRVEPPERLSTSGVRVAAVGTHRWHRRPGHSVRVRPRGGNVASVDQHRRERGIGGPQVAPQVEQVGHEPALLREGAGANGRMCDVCVLRPRYTNANAASWYVCVVCEVLRWLAAPSQHYPSIGHPGPPISSQLITTTKERPGST